VPPPDPIAEHDDAALVAAWRAAAADPAVAADLDALYADVAAEIRARGPVCWASGRCCNFVSAGHLLYATGLETAHTLRQLNPDAHPPLTPLTIADARARGGCPFQSANLCGIHPIRPLGCRIYFCDRSAQDWQQDLYERALARLRAIHDDRGIPYRYAEWRTLLDLFAAHP
jgi:Fe-S-cluster containining protein